MGKQRRGADPLVRGGDLHQAFLDLGKVRPVFQEMFKRNGLSFLAVQSQTQAQAQDAAIQTIRTRLDAVKAVAEAGLAGPWPALSEPLNPRTAALGSAARVCRSGG